MSQAPSELLQLIDPQFDEATASRVSGTIAAAERHHQPWRLIHGGFYTAAIETFATIGAFQAVKDTGQHVVGVSNGDLVGHAISTIAPLRSES